MSNNNTAAIKAIRPQRRGLASGASTVSMTLAAATRGALVSILGSASAMSRLGGSEGGESKQVGAHQIERPAEDGPIGGVDPRQHLLDQIVGHRFQIGQHRYRFVGQEQLPGATVRRVASALDQPRFLEPIDHPAKRDWLDFEQIGERALVDPLVAAERGEGAPLRARGADLARALVETAAHQPRNVAKQETE